MSKFVFLTGILMVFAFVPIGYAQNCNVKVSDGYSNEELFDLIQNHFSNTSVTPVNGFVRFSKNNRAEKELYLVDIPTIKLGQKIQYNRSCPLDAHPIGGALVHLINRVPKGESISISVFQFSNLLIRDALLAAMARGVKVKIQMSALPGNDEDSESDAITNEVMAREINQKFPGTVLLCKRGTLFGKPGGCLGNLLHHKFVLFSKVCNQGLLENSTCRNQTHESQVVFQSMWNFTNVYNSHNIASVFMGAASLYKFYINHFDLMQVSGNPKSNKPVNNQPLMVNGEKEISNFFGGGTLRVFFTPKAIANNNVGNLFLDEFRKIQKPQDCKLIRIAHKQWDNSGGYAQEKNILAELERLSQLGCKVQILLAKQFTKESDLYKKLKKIVDVKTAANLNIDGVIPEIHSKYFIIDRRPISKLKPIIQFGTISFGGESQIFNDNAWLKWENPSKTMHQAYSDAFDMIWNATPN